MYIKLKISVLLMAILVGFSGCARTPIEQDETRDLDGKKVLIVYLTRTQNTKAVAEIIQQQIGGDLVALELENPYPTNYQAHVDQVAEENRTNFLPKLKTKIDSIEKYDVVFIGFPTWGMQLPPPFKTFLTEYDLNGKTIIPFNTNAGYGVGSGFETIKQLASKSKLLKGLVLEGGKERDGILYVMEGEKLKTVKSEVQKWLKEVGISLN